MSDQKFVLYRQRDFSQKMNITIDYIREHFSGLIKPILIIAIPMGVIYAIITSWMMGGLGNMMDSPEQSLEFMMQAQATNMVNLAVVLVAYSFLIAVICTYIKEADAGRKHEPMDLIKLSSKYVLGLIGLMFLCGLVSIVGMIFLIIPGIYLMVATSLSASIYMFEDISVSDAFSKSFKLIRGKWWSTFGLMIVSGIIAFLIGFLFAIPSYIVLFADFFTNQESLESDPFSMFQSFDTWYGSLMTAFSTVGSYCSYLVPIMALSFQYFNLSERMEGTGLKSQIEDFENLS